MLNYVVSCGNLLISKLMSLFRPLKTCYSISEKAYTLYTNDISHFYDLISRMTNLKKQCTCLKQAHAVMKKFEKLMSVTASVEKQQEQRHKMSTLVGLPNDLDWVHDQNLASPNVPSIDELVSTLLRLATSPSHHTMISSSTIDPCVLASQTMKNRASQTTENRQGRGHLVRSRPKSNCCIACTHS